MRRTAKIFLFLGLTPFILAGSYVIYLWATYIDDSVTLGHKYGFSIGSSDEETYMDILGLTDQYPNAVFYISYGPRAGDNDTVRISPESFKRALSSEHWQILLDGEGEFHNIIRLNIENSALTRIYRHRKYFELP